jgi:UDP-N-acetylmuramoyl-tripeptide--D-alanyl-D-alanine ligase
MMQLQQALPWIAGARLVGDGSVRVQRVHSDTRSIAPGDLFVALKGEKFDANQMLQAAQAQGAVAALCLADLPAGCLPAGLPRIEVADTRIALGQLATGWRAQWKLPLIAVTGSNGKTTVTQMIASILAAFAPGDAHLATRGNLNNDIGVPMTLLRLRASHRIAVVELGMNHPGEIATLAAMAQPTVALVNNAQREHLEFMQTVEAVARENGSVISALPLDGVAVFPADDAYTAVWEALAQPRTVARFALEATTQADDLACVSSQWADGAWQVHAAGAGVVLRLRLQIAGRHNVKNALAAARCALAAGVPVSAVEQGLDAFVPVNGRSRAVALTTSDGVRTLVDDSYNANPDSVRAAIEVLRDLPGPRLLVLGDMGEVGQQGPAFHAEAGAYAKAQGIEHLLCLGTLGQLAAQAFPGARHCDGIDALNAAALDLLPSVQSVLVKGSRFMRMERVVQALQGAAQTPPASPSNGEKTCC